VPLRGVGNVLFDFGAVLSQIIFESRFSKGNMVTASRNTRKKARKNISSIIVETTMASKIIVMAVPSYCGYSTNLIWSIKT
jgi:hypothetical protein